MSETPSDRLDIPATAEDRNLILASLSYMAMEAARHHDTEVLKDCLLIQYRILASDPDSARDLIEQDGVGVMWEGTDEELFERLEATAPEDVTLDMFDLDDSGMVDIDIDAA